MAGLCFATQHVRKSVGLSSAALLVLLAAPARTGIIAANFISANYLLYRLHLTGTRHAGLFQLAPLSTLESFFHIIHRRGCTAAMIGSERAGRLAVEVSTRADACRRRTLLRSLDHLH